jgi:hypothetical protein
MTIRPRDEKMLEAFDHEPDREHKQQHERSDQPSLRPNMSTIVRAPMRAASANDNED